MAHWTSPTRVCHCGRTLVLHEVQPLVKGAKAVRGALCPTCDRRRCTRCSHYIQSAHAQHCPKCRADLRSA